MRCFFSRVLAVLIIISGFGACFLHSQSPLKLDVKTKFKQKHELIGIKHGVIYFLKQSGYNIVEFGEDYAVWLVDFREKHTEPDKYTINVTIDITRPTLLIQKKPVVSGTVETYYTFNSKMLNVDDTGFIDFIKEKIKNIKNKELVRAFYVGRLVVMKVKLLLLELRKGKKTI